MKLYQETVSKIELDKAEKEKISLTLGILDEMWDECTYISEMREMVGKAYDALRQLAVRCDVL